MASQMDSPPKVIDSVSTPKYGVVKVVTSDGSIYLADFISFQDVYCFPKNQAVWQEVSIDSFGLGLIWSSKFEVHLDQIIGLSEKPDPGLASS